MGEPELTVRRFVATVPMVVGGCPECGAWATFTMSPSNLLGDPLVEHEHEADREACPITARQRRLDEIMAEAGKRYRIIEEGKPA